MNICDLLFQSADKTKALIESKKENGLSEDEAVDELVDEVINQTKSESESGVVHGIVEKIMKKENEL